MIKIRKYTILILFGVILLAGCKKLENQDSEVVIERNNIEEEQVPGEEIIPKKQITQININHPNNYLAKHNDLNGIYRQNSMSL